MAAGLGWPRGWKEDMERRDVCGGGPGRSRQKPFSLIHGPSWLSLGASRRIQLDGFLPTILLDFGALVKRKLRGGRIVEITGIG